jgi:aminoglycoside 2'-N-acetyltransferase I
MNFKVSIDVKPGSSLSQNEIREVIDLCSLAFEEDFSSYLDEFDDPVHVLAKLDGILVSHALWITRWIEIRGLEPLKTAYVEGVATGEIHRGKGYATAIMKRLAGEIQGYDIGALSPADTTLYTRLGWEYWQGPLYARKKGDWVRVPEETAMILRTPKTPSIDIQAPLSIEWRKGDVW